MAVDYKIVNIRELEDMAVKFGLSPNVEARFGRSATDAKQGGFSYQKLAPDFRSRSATGTRGKRSSTSCSLVVGTLRSTTRNAT